MTPRADQPKRIQSKRTKGWRMPEGAVYVGRPTKWGNPIVVDDFWNAGYSGPEIVARRWAVERFRFWITSGGLSLFGVPPQPTEIRQLRGKDLACWCPLDSPCHADVLLRMAND